MFLTLSPSFSLRLFVCRVCVYGGGVRSVFCLVCLFTNEVEVSNYTHPSAKFIGDKS